MKIKQIIDITGTPLTPSRQGEKCLGNGEHPKYECCCDECDFYLKCFPQYDLRLKRNKLKKWFYRLIGKDFVQLFSYDIILVRLVYCIDLQLYPRLPNSIMNISA